MVPLSPHPAVLGIFMFLNGIATGALENGNLLLDVLIERVSLTTSTCILSMGISNSKRRVVLGGIVG